MAKEPHAAFKGAGEEPGLAVWRIENMQPVLLDPKEHGKFYDGDSYICLKTTKKPGFSSLVWDIFFWLGAETTKDESGAAALLTVDLDDYLGGAPTQHREVQEHESEQFLQCFKTLRVEKGGVASGFKTVERGVYETRLLHLKGKRTVRVKQVECAAASLNHGDVFILDMGLQIYQWNGADCNKKEKAKGLEVMLAIKDDERGGKAQLHVFDAGGEPAAFWAALGGEGAVAPAVADHEAHNKDPRAAKLLVVSDASGAMCVDEVATGALAKEMLKTEDCFIVDNDSEIFVWVGKGATAAERKEALARGQDYVAKHGRPDWTKVTKVNEATEPPMFKACFATWQETSCVIDFSQTPRSGSSKVALQKQGSTVDQLVDGMMGMFNKRALHRKATMRSMVDDGSGKVEVWRIEDFAEVEVETAMVGQFFAGDSYIVQYTYKEGSRQAYLLYFWLGAQSSQDEKGAAALLTKTKDDGLGGAATQVRVVQGQEPAHFVRLFHGKMVVHSGGKASGFSNSAEGDYYDTDGVSLFHVKGTDDLNTKAAQVDEVAASLNSGDCFVLLTPGKVTLWEGKFSNEAEVEVARSVAELMKGSRELVEVKEGEEEEAFWEALGGKGEYVQMKEAPPSSREPTLFLCSNATGAFEVEPIFDFSQADLEDDDVYLLDVYTNLYVWVGSQANEKEKEMALSTASEYAKANGYSEDVSTVIVHAGSEPLMFTCNFLGWDASKTHTFQDPYETKLAAALAANEAEDEASTPKGEGPRELSRRLSSLKKIPLPPEELPAPAKPAPFEPPPAAAPAATSSYKDPSANPMAYEELKGGLPAGVDPTKKEQYLSDADFEKVMKSPRSEFNAMKAWKQQQIKKAAGLY